jgi:hypothetical protein
MVIVTVVCVQKRSEHNTHGKLDEILLSRAKEQSPATSFLSTLEIFSHSHSLHFIIQVPIGEEESSWNEKKTQLDGK